MEENPLLDEINKFGMQDIIIDLFNSLSAVRELSEINCQGNNEKKLIKNALAALIHNQDMERCSFFLLNDEGYLVNLTGTSSCEIAEESNEDYSPIQFKVGEGVIGVAAETGELQNCPDCQKDERFSEYIKDSECLMPGSVISVPVFAAGNELLGVLNISHPEAHYFSEWHVRLLEIYKNMMGQLISNFRLLQNMEDQVKHRTIKLEEALIDLEKLRQHFESASMLDQLTGLYNRRYFYDQVEAAVANTKRYGQALCLLILDLDFFKDVNDCYGHGFGDKVLVKISEALQQQVRESDILVRFGGEEFIVIFTNTNCTNGMVFSERIRSTIEVLKWEDKENFSQTVSIGLFCLGTESFTADHESEMNIDKIIHYADTALYKAKELGRNKVVLFSKDMLKKTI